MSVLVLDREAPVERITAERMAFQLQGVRIAAMVLIAEPSHLGQRAIGDYLAEIPYMDDVEGREQISKWLARAGITNPWRPGCTLRCTHRRLLAGQLAAFLKANGAG